MCLKSLLLQFLTFKNEFVFVYLQFANLFETCSDWLLYISEWRQGSTNLSNVKVTTKVAVSSLLGDTSSLQDYGSAMMHNFSTKDVKSVVSYSDQIGTQ